MASVKKNIILNGINTATGILYPVITFPYAARVLSPDGIGTINFLNSIIGYIVLLTSLGIPMYAVKEIAKYQDNKIERDKITLEIIILSTILCLLGYVAVWLLAQFVPQIHQHESLFFILSLTIIFTAIGVNWFYQGIEDFKFITIRAIIIRTLAAVALFVFVKEKSDLLIYGIIFVCSTVGNNFVNFIHLRKHLEFNLIKLRDICILRHIKPALQIFIFNLVTSLYVQLDLSMLGLMSTDEATGYFTAGTRITHIGLLVISSLGTVLMPHCSHLLQIGDKESFAYVIKKSLNLTLAISIPMMSGLMLLATPVTIIFCGEGYIDSIPVLYLNAPVIVFIALTNVMGIQILYPMDKIKIVILSVSCGAVLNLILNLFLIPDYREIGAAISTLVAEFAVLVIQLIRGWKYYPFKISDLFNVRYIMASAIMSVAVFFDIQLSNSLILQLISGTLIGIIVYVYSLYCMKDSLTLELTSLLRNKIIKH